MPDIELVRSHCVSIPEAKERLQRIADELGTEYDLTSEWKGNILRFQRAGLHGEAQVSASKIRLDATLSFLLKPLRAALVDRIERKFEKVFPEPMPGEKLKKPER